MVDGNWPRKHLPPTELSPDTPFYHVQPSNRRPTQTDNPIHSSCFQRRDPCPTITTLWWSLIILRCVSLSLARRVALSHTSHVADNDIVEVLVERRRLGHTSLNVKPGAVGISPSTTPANLGKFDYAHLRVPLPKQLNGSGVHKPQKAGLVPESYFLMVHSSAHRYEMHKLTNSAATEQRRFH